MKPPADWARARPLWPNHASSQFARAGITKWHYQRAGSGPGVLLLHGAGGATHSWRDLLPLLSACHEVLAPDLPGHAFSVAPSGGASTLPAMAREVSELLAHLDFAPETIVGHSAGAAIALEMVTTGLAAPRVVIGLNAALMPFSGLAGALFPPMARMLALNPVTPWAFSRLAGWTAQTRRLIEGTGSRLDPEALATYARLLGNPRHVSGALSMMAHWELEPLLPRLADLTCLVHLLTGSRDGAVPPETSRQIADRHDTVHHHPIEGLGHLMHEEDPEQVADLITELIAEVCGDRSGRVSNQSSRKAKKP